MATEINSQENPVCNHNQTKLGLKFLIIRRYFTNIEVISTTSNQYDRLSHNPKDDIYNLGKKAKLLCCKHTAVYKHSNNYRQNITDIIKKTGISRITINIGIRLIGIIEHKLVHDE